MLDNGGIFLFDSLDITSPKRNRHSQTDWEIFFPYYAGFPETFVRSILSSANLPKDALILDPWNGSGTTTYVASHLGFSSRGLDLNPVMAVVARARLLAPSEADSLVPLAQGIIKHIRADQKILDKDDPLLWWYSPSTAALIRGIEKRFRQRLVGEMTLTPSGTRIERISGLAATFYVALFSVCRELAASFRSSNPTWFRRPKRGEAKVDACREHITNSLLKKIQDMAAVLASHITLIQHEHGTAEVRLFDTTDTQLGSESVDFVITSPPYCTRIDYTAATRIELAVLNPLIHLMPDELGRKMIGSTRVPDHEISISKNWGDSCIAFLEAIWRHHSKASKGYYYKTHLDYFDKIFRSLGNISKAMKPGATAILVVQNSYYKDIHNNLPSIITEMGLRVELWPRRRQNFHLRRSMAGINPHTQAYRRSTGAVESVLCFEKS